jgi:ABC-type antimicrobial peptide transport system permease subunit
LLDSKIKKRVIKKILISFISIPTLFLSAEIKALEEAAKREAENTTLARFIRNFESRIFAQLSRQLVEQLFGENPATEGSFSLFDNIISWTSDGTYITLTIYNTLDETTTEITIPIGDFGFGG